MMKLFRPLALCSVLFIAGAGAVHAQEGGEAPAAEGEGGGMGPVPGYLATGMLAGLVIFLLCKSARR